MAEVAGFGFGLSNNLHGHFELVPDADGQITDLAKNVELSSRVFEEASRVFDDAEIKAVQNGDAVGVAQTLIGDCHGIFEKIERILDEGRKNGLPRPFKVHEIDLLHANLDMNKSTMQLLLSTLEVARQRISEDLSALGEETSFQKMEELIPVVEESVKQYERLRAKSILEDGTSTP
ncbi:hypothetical protein SLS56_005324 [Neofusicoccum ribis]|uniref:Uncharacterized protein n=1 Tax=Neofusicoccum ribis TaxID=45134 RepID=A0ABR3STU5_9PEZI